MVQTIRREDYRAPAHLIDEVRLEFDLDAESTAVVNTMHVRPNPAANGQDASLFLDGEDLTLVSVALDGKPLDESRYMLSQEGLLIRDIREPATVTIVNRFSPAANTALSGIYVSGQTLISQCEAQGFRRITFYMDRPDVLAKFTTVIRASKETFPVLLSNGNAGEAKDLEDGRHEVTFVDPFPKPSYLFALVAGQLVCREEKFRLKDGRLANLSVWVEPQDLDKTEHTLESLKKAIRWDEERWGLELDLDDFKIVATKDFNFGAMENKGLNIFNSKCALANPNVATDEDYFHIESVVGHEYFHNWTGDRITLRDWFQLTLKEGLTVFRDQEFSADMLGEPSARAVQRIKDVISLRAAQFPEDASPMAHPIRPDSYQEINNFYTMTVYEKGAEVIRMLQTLLGRDTFRKGFDEYIAKNDGSAVTCEAFLEAMTSVSKRDLRQFKRWFSQAGTPRVKVRSNWNEEEKKLTLSVSQTTPSTPGQPVKQPFLMPFPVALLNGDGIEMPVKLEGESGAGVAGTRMLELTENSQEFVFVDLAEKPVLSLNRGFAAPIILDAGLTREERLFLAARDGDPFNRWDAMNGLLIEAVRDETRARLLHEPHDIDPRLLETVGAILKDESLSPAFKAVALAMPTEKIVSETLPVIDPHAVHAAWVAVRNAIAKRNLSAFMEAAEKNVTPSEYDPSAEPAGKRALKNLALGYAIAAGNARATILVKDQFTTATNLTDKLAALRLMVNSQTPAKEDMEVDALKAWAGEPLLLNKWLQIQSTASSFAGESLVLERVRELVRCDFFSIRNPNNVYSLLMPFFTANPAEFHLPDGSGYAFWAEMVLELNRINPQVASRVARALENWRRYVSPLASRMHDALESVYARREELSPNVLEIIEKSLNNPV